MQVVSRDSFALAACPLLLLARAAASPSPVSVTFYRHIAPIIYQKCAPCHRPGESAPFSLMTYSDVRRRAQQIAAVTKSRYMPPWLAEPGYGDFVEERRLDDREIQLIQDWVRQGVVPGSPSDGPPAPVFSSEWRLGKPDLVLQVQRPYQLYAEGREVFWNFVIPVPLKSARWVRAIEIRPGNPRVIHHASIILDRSGTAQKREQVPGAGFAGMDLTLAETTFDPDSNFLAWKPGSVPMPEPEGMAWRADPGMNLIFNVHLRPTGKPETVAPTIGLYFTDRPRTKFAMLLELEHDGSIDIPPGDRDYVVSDDFRCPLDLKILAIYPHAHYLGKLLEGYATLPDGTRKWLIRIPSWDLNWQGVYHFKEPVTLPKDSVISMRFHYDNSADNIRNPNRPPRRVKGGPQANDEMGNLWLQVLPVASGDQRAVLQETVVRRQIEKYPLDFTANFNFGDLLLGRGEAAGAVPYFERAWKAEPRNPLAATELGLAFASANRLPEAEQQFRRALELDPKFTDARYNLASAEAAEGKWEPAVADFRQVVSDRPNESRPKDRLGKVLVSWGDQLADSGRAAEAELRYREALSLRPHDLELRNNLGVVLVQQGKMQEGQKEFEEALRIDPSFAPARKALEALRTRRQ